MKFPNLVTAFVSIRDCKQVSLNNQVPVEEITDFVVGADTKGTLRDGTV